MTTTSRMPLRDPTVPLYAQLLERPAPFHGTAWGTWGSEDQLGTLNHLSAERVLEARECILTGAVIPLNLSLTAFDPPLIAHRGAIEHTVFGLNEFHRDDRLDSFFPQASTQVDSLRHFGHPDHGFYNGIAPSELEVGSTSLGIQAAAQHGIVGRGLLIDVCGYRNATGRPIDQTRNEQIPVSDLDAALEWQGSSTHPGDILMIRTGWLEHFQTHPRPDGALCSPGLQQSEETAAWLWDHQVALAAADNVALEAWPATESELTVMAELEGSMPRSSHSGMLHRILIPLLGLTIGELWKLDELAIACASRGRYDVFVTVQPLNLPGGVGSPANAVAVL